MRAQRQTQKLRHTFAEELRTVEDIVVGLVPADYAAPPVHPGWDVRLLCAGALGRLTDVSAQLERPSASRPVTLERYASHLLATRHRRYDRAVDTAGQDTGPLLGDQLVAVIEDVVAGVVEGDLPALVDTGAGQLSLLDFLRVHVLELVLFHDDLARTLRAAGRQIVAPPVEATATAVRTSADILAARAPGKAIEVRIPPFAAVQIGDPVRATPGGVVAPEPAHTRGTPPAVIETDATTFLRVMSGRMSWDSAVADHGVMASGLRTDLSPLLPLIA
ncbi:hypothetical protein Rai3103_11395 [Raineyella fluvialis]|uniref:Bacterial SCP orthologue domain-containing protein n=2 Tax=Raineyella fluvialis TaxID=2662261 RepID=A0A5Q2FFK5_9ACTN|nr:hypothetical protein Rai3103_11395 [Raineyella fluvialis]